MNEISSRTRGDHGVRIEKAGLLVAPSKWKHSIKDMNPEKIAVTSA